MFEFFVVVGMCLRVHESRVKSSYYHYHTTLSSHEFAVFNALGGSVDKISPTFFVFVCLCLQYLSEEFNCNISLWNKIDNVPCRLFISNIINCKPFRESEIAKVNYFGWYQLRRKTKGSEEKWVFSYCYHIPDVCFPHQYPKKRKGDEF